MTTPPQPTKEEFRAAQAIKLPFGRYKGKTLEKIAETDDGLLYLDWVSEQSWLQDPTKKHILNYLADPTIAKELGEIT